MYSNKQLSLISIYENIVTEINQLHGLCMSHWPRSRGNILPALEKHYHEINDVNKTIQDRNWQTAALKQTTVYKKNINHL